MLCRSDAPQYLAAPARLVGIGPELLVEIDRLITRVRASEQAPVDRRTHYESADSDDEAVIEQVFGRGIRARWS
jgi:hypothetical protein